ncbi:hypothetical protein ACFQZZ_01575 [Nocardia sp. GCM10030253]|uniref:hypothetical protein n=1 Tax=Nocardia sp. GCM10030253 TaxID=3273404 RepID=UPI0036372C74
MTDQEPMTKSQVGCLSTILIVVAALAVGLLVLGWNFTQQELTPGGFCGGNNVAEDAECVTYDRSWNEISSKSGRAAKQEELDTRHVFGWIFIVVGAVLMLFAVVTVKMWRDQVKGAAP